MKKLLGISALLIGLSAPLAAHANNEAPLDVLTRLGSSEQAVRSANAGCLRAPVVQSYVDRETVILKDGERTAGTILQSEMALNRAKEMAACYVLDGSVAHRDFVLHTSHFLIIAAETKYNAQGGKLSANDDLVKDARALLSYGGLSTSTGDLTARLDRIAPLPKERADLKSNAVEAHTLIDTFHGNQMRFERDYEGREVVSSGGFASAEKGDGGYHLFLKPKQDTKLPLEMLECFIDEGNATNAKIANLNDGQDVSVKGTARSIDSIWSGRGLQLQNCSIL